MNQGINQNKLHGIQDAMRNGIIFNVLLVWIDNGMKESDGEAAELMTQALKSVGNVSLYGEEGS